MINLYSNGDKCSAATREKNKLQKESILLINSLRVFQIDGSNQIKAENFSSLNTYKTRNNQAVTARADDVSSTIQRQIYKDNVKIPSRTSNVLNLGAPFKYLEFDCPEYEDYFHN